MKRLVPLLICGFLILAGCQPADEGDMDAYVQTALAETAVMQTLVVQGAAATFAAIPTETLTPTPTLTPTITPLPPVTAELVLNAYCRPGPGTVYGQGKLLEKGVIVQVIGREDETGAWLLVQLSDSTDTCWIAKEALAITGETAWVEIVLAPPTPTLGPSWTGAWTTWYTMSAVEYTSIANFTQTGNQFYGIVTFSGGPPAMVFDGIVSADGMRVDGTLRYPYTHTFLFVRDSNNFQQFRGKIWSGYEPPMPLCGTRISGGTKPSPCLP